MRFQLPKVMRIHLIFVTSAIIAILSGSKSIIPPDEKLKGYDLSAPDLVLSLPDQLHEISGITYIDQNIIGCVQDERGIIYIYDLLNKKIKSQLNFSYDGDYEGITRVGKTIYVLRSDGTIFEIYDYTSAKSKVTPYKTGIPAADNEGLCYDQKNNRLLIACKSKTLDADKNKDKRHIYAFNLKTKTLIREASFIFDVEEIGKFAIKNNMDIPVKDKKGGKGKEADFRFETSGIAIHPLTGKLHLLSSTDNLLFVFNMDGAIEHIEKLKNKLFPQPEGITFLPNGDMLISNEGRDKQGILLRFNYK